MKGIFFILLLLIPNAIFASCSVSGGVISFGNYDVFSSQNTDTSGTINVSCSGAAITAVTLALNSGMNGTISQRKMQAAGSQTAMLYNLYVDPGCTTIWGDGTGSSITVSGNVPNNGTTPFTVYGRVFASQDLSVGSYTDNVTITVTF